MLVGISRFYYEDCFGLYVILYNHQDRCWTMLPKHGGIVYYCGSLDSCVEIMRKNHPNLYSTNLINLMYGYDKPTLMGKIKGWFK